MPFERAALLRNSCEIRSAQHPNNFAIEDAHIVSGSAKLDNFPKRLRSLPVAVMYESKLCGTCQEIFSEGANTGDILSLKTHHADRELLFQAVEKGCYVCSWALRDYKWSRSQEHRASQPVHHTVYKWDDYIDEQVMSACDGLQLNINVYDALGDHSSTSTFWLLGSMIEGTCYSIPKAPD